MADFLWQPSGGAEVDEAIMRFTAGDDVLHDRVLFPHDIRATTAHVHGLSRIGILTTEEAERLAAALEKLLAAFESGEFVLDDQFEDGHSAIEAWLTQHLADLGSRVHTGRSRNDQVAVATRLYMREQLSTLARQIVAIAGACLEVARQNEFLAMPGYTHLQRAVPSSVGLWMAGFAESFSEDLAFALGVFEVLDSNPLGTAAGYGVNLPLDRKGISEDLQFSRLHINPMAVQNARGKLEIMCLQAAEHALQDVRRLSWDLSLFTTSEFGFVRLPDRYTTGSSIMPNKRNPDVVELLRGQVAVVTGAISEIQGVLGLPSGYHRDLQLTKPPLVRGLSRTMEALAIVPDLVASLEFDEARMRSAIDPELFATDRAVAAAAKGIPFREAYRQAKEELAGAEPGKIEQSLRDRVSLGACGDLSLDEIQRRLERLQRQLIAE